MLYGGQALELVQSSWWGSMQAQLAGTHAGRQGAQYPAQDVVGMQGL